MEWGISHQLLKEKSASSLKSTTGGTDALKKSKTF
jgi:hypothetical protein